MKLLFYHPKSRSDGYPDPPLGLGYLMSIAKKMGFKYEFYDEEHHSKIFTLDKLVMKFNPDILVVSFMTPQYYDVLKIIKKFKKQFPEAKIIVGGPHSSSLPEQTLKEIKEIDFLCKGEGEKTFEEFLNYLSGNMKLDKIDGLFYRRKDMIIANNPRKLMDSRDLNDYSVDWEKILEYGPYKQKFNYKDIIGPIFSIITTRGCPFQCTFCDERTIWERKVRMRSIDNVVEEIKYLIQKFGAKTFNIWDDTFTLDKTRVIEFCKKIKPLNIEFKITAKTTTVDEEMLFWLKTAGCKLIAYGVESGDDEVLKSMKKAQTVNDIKKASKLTKNSGILFCALCMVGNIGEDMNAVKKTYKLIKEIQPDLFSCTIMTPFPGSENFSICKKNGWIKNYNWEHWSPSAMKVGDYKVISRTDKMNEKQMLNAYYYMNKLVLTIRFKRKYGKYFMLNPRFFFSELFPRLKTIGPRAFLKHGNRILQSNLKKINKDY